jgi:hypothetical protein
VEDDLRRLELNWRIKAMERTEQRKICEAAKILQEPCSISKNFFSSWAYYQFLWKESASWS